MQLYNQHSLGKMSRPMNEYERFDDILVYKQKKLENKRVREELRKEAGIDEYEMEKALREQYFKYHRGRGRTDTSIQKEIDDFRRAQDKYNNEMEKRS